MLSFEMIYFMQTPSSIYSSKNNCHLSLHCHARSAAASMFPLLQKALASHLFFSFPAVDDVLTCRYVSQIINSTLLMQLAFCLYCYQCCLNYTYIFIIDWKSSKFEKAAGKIAGIWMNTKWYIKRIRSETTFC